jgi:hypothetical protein
MASAALSILERRRDQMFPELDPFEIYADTKLIAHLEANPGEGQSCDRRNVEKHGGAGQ